MRHSQKVCLITGAGRGIGREIALYLASQGAKLALADLNLSDLEDLCGELKQQDREVLIAKTDVTNAAEVNSLVNQTIEKFAALDVLVNNAGISIDNLFMRFKKEDWDKVMSVNLDGAFYCSQAAIKPMLKKRWGRIINISSVIGQMGNAGQAAYASSKAALFGLTKTLARELGSRNITVNAVAPGFIQTPMTDKLPAEVKKSYFQQIALGKFGKAEDVAKIVSFLASDEAEYITGQTIHVNGGLLMP